MTLLAGKVIDRMKSDIGIDITIPAKVGLVLLHHGMDTVRGAV